MIASTEANERLALPTSGPAFDCKDWRTKPTLPSEFGPILGKIKSLVEGGLTLMHVLGDFLKCQIAPLQQSPRPA